MKVAFVGGFAFSPKGTMSARAHPLAAELVKAGHEVTMVLSPYDNPQDCGREWKLEGVRIKNVGGKSSPDRKRGRLAKLEYPSLLFELIREVGGYRPDLIHIFKPKGFAGAIGTYFLLRGAPIVLDCDDWEGWRGWNDVKPYPWLVKEYIDRQERWMTRRANAVTVASRVLEQRALELRGRDAGVYYLPNCGASDRGRKLQAAVRSVSVSETRRQLGFPEGPVVLFSGHKDDLRAVRVMQSAATRIAKQIPLTLVVIGDGIKLSPSANDNVRLVQFPRLNYRDFLRVVRACDVAGFPYSADAVHHAKCSARIVDYMAMGKAVLTSAVGENLEYIVDGESGILVAPGDEQVFAAQLERMVRDPELRVRLGTNAAERIATKFRWEDEALKQCLAAYEWAISLSKTKRTRTAVNTSHRRTHDELSRTKAHLS